MFYSKSKSSSSKSSKDQSSKKTSKTRSKFFKATIILLLLILASSSAYIYFFKNSDVIEIFPDNSIIKIKAKINANLEDLIKKDSIIYDIIMKKRELEGKKTQLSESPEDPIDILLNKSSGKDYFSIEYNVNESIESDDVFSKYSCVEPKEIPSKNPKQQQPKEYNFKIIENQDEENQENPIAAKLKNLFRYCCYDIFALEGT